MVDLVMYAIPVFLLCLALEWASFRFLPDDDELGYELRDAAASVSIGIGSTVFDGAMKVAAVLTYAAVFALSPWQLSATDPYAWALLFLADDLAYYWFHRAHHEVRMLWACHAVHHSSRFFNLSTALRQSWTPMTIYPFWLPLALFFPPWMILAQQSVSLIYQFFLHTERIDRMWRPVEAVMNTPSHHRVHHGSNDRYLDRNYGGVLIVWDRLFGTFEAEGERVVYGLTRDVTTYNPLRVAFHEWAALGSDIRRAPDWRTRMDHLLRGPGWQPTSPSPALTGDA